MRSVAVQLGLNDAQVASIAGLAPSTRTLLQRFSAAGLDHEALERRLFPSHERRDTGPPTAGLGGHRAGA